MDIWFIWSLTWNCFLLVFKNELSYDKWMGSTWNFFGQIRGNALFFACMLLGVRYRWCGNVLWQLCVAFCVQKRATETEKKYYLEHQGQSFVDFESLRTSSDIFLVFWNIIGVISRVYRLEFSSSLNRFCTCLWSNVCTVFMFFFLINNMLICIVNLCCFSQQNSEVCCSGCFIQYNVGTKSSFFRLT